MFVKKPLVAAMVKSGLFLQHGLHQRGRAGFKLSVLQSSASSQPATRLHGLGMGEGKASKHGSGLQ